MSKPVITDEHVKKYVPSTEVWLFKDKASDDKWTILSILTCLIAVSLITIYWFFQSPDYQKGSWDLGIYWAISVMAPTAIVAIIHALRYGNYLLTGYNLNYSEDRMPTSEARPVVIAMWLFFTVISLLFSIFCLMVYFVLYLVLSNLIVLIAIASVVVFSTVVYYLRKKRQRELVTFEILKRGKNG